MTAYLHMLKAMKEAYSYSDVDVRLDIVYYQTCQKCGEKLREYSCRRLGDNYGRRFVHCPGYELPTAPDGTPMLPLDSEWSILSKVPRRCHFEWLDPCHPEAAIDCIMKLIEKLEHAESQVETLKEQLLYG